MSECVGSMLNYVDNQIHEEGMSRLKLLLYPLLPWKELEKCTKPSEIYRILESGQETREEALQIFLFALKAIGGSKRGKQCAKKSVEMLWPDHVPSELEFQQQTSAFRFFFWLLKVARRLPQVSQENLKRRYANLRGINYRFITNIPQLFIQLYQDKTISERDSGELIKELERCGAHFGEDSTERKEVEKCITYLCNCNEAYPFSSGDEDSTAQSMYESDFQVLNPTPKRSPKVRRPKRKKPTSSSCHFLNYDADSDTVQSSTSERDSDSVQSSISGHVDLQEPADGWNSSSSEQSEEDITESGHNSETYYVLAALLITVRGCTPRRPWISGFKSWTVAILLLIALTCVTAFLVVHNPPPSYEKRYAAGSTVILGEFTGESTDHISVQENIHPIDSSHVVNVFKSTKECHHQPFKDSLLEFSGTTQRAIGPLHMFENSTIRAKMCSSTNYGESDRIQFILIQGISNFLSFDLSNAESEYFYQSVTVGKHGSLNCVSIERIITENDDYTVMLLPPAHSITFFYSMTLMIRTLDVDVLKHTETIVKLTKVDEGSKIHFSFGSNLLLYCIMAHIENNSNPFTKSFTSLNVDFEPRLTVPAFIIVFLFFEAFLIVLLKIAIYFKT